MAALYYVLSGEKSNLGALQLEFLTTKYWQQKVMPPLWELQDAPELTISDYTISDIQTLKHFTMLCLLPVNSYIKMLPLTVHPS